MTAIVRDWLPWGAAARQPVKDAIGSAVSSWSSAWFAKGSVRVSDVSATPGTPRQGDALETWRLFGSAVAVKCSKAASGRLISSALDVAAEQFTSSEADRRVLNAFELKLLADLCLRIERVLDVDSEPRAHPVNVADPYQGLGGVEVRLADGHGLLALAMAIPLSCITRLCKASLPEPRQPGEPLGALMNSVGALPVQVDASLGSVEITVSELEALDRGDVIALPIPLTGLAELRFRDTGRVCGRGRLTEATDHKAILLES